MIDLKKSESETEEQYLWKIGQLVDSGQIENWASINNVVNREILGDDETLYRTESAWRKKYQAAKKFKVNCFEKMINSGYADEIAAMKRELDKARIKLQTEKLEYNKWLREEARDELIVEKICDAISTLPPYTVPTYIEPKHDNRAYALIYSDEHFGAEFEIRGLFNEIINAYNPEIFKSRMWDLFHQTVEIIKKEKIDTLNVFSMGDCCDGILRVSQLMKLKYGVVEGAIKYADFICYWLNQLTKYVRVNFQMTDGNHTELRMLGQKKGTFTDDNMGKVIKEFIKTRLKDNHNFTFIENPTGYIYSQLVGYNILGIHGEVKNMDVAIKDFSKTYNVLIDYLLGGHLHHTRIEDAGVNSEVINVPSIMGTNPYALSLNKTSNAAGKLLIFEEGKGIVCEYRMKLN